MRGKKERKRESKGRKFFDVMFILRVQIITQFYIGIASL
jgi:hypothetical protein